MSRSETMSSVKILRVLRVLRPLRAINRAKGLKVRNNLTLTYGLLSYYTIYKIYFEKLVRSQIVRQQIRI